MDKNVLIYLIYNLSAYKQICMLYKENGPTNVTNVTKCSQTKTVLLSVINKITSN